MFASFEPLPKDVARKEKQYAEDSARKSAKVKQIVNKNRYIELKNPFYNISSYYLDPVSRKVLEADFGSEVGSDLRQVTEPDTLRQLRDYNIELRNKNVLS